jgi:DNA recombination protein RmuC
VQEVHRKEGPRQRHTPFVLSDPMITGIVAGLLAGTLLGALVAWSIHSAHARAREAQLRSTFDTDLATKRAEVASLQTSLESERSAAGERRAALEELRHQLVGEFAELSRRALSQNSTQFLELADTRLREAQQTARGELDQRRQAIDQLFVPLREQLGHYEESVRQLELERQKAYSQLSVQVDQLNRSQQKLEQETRNLVTALRSPATRGRWGEIQLRRVVEMAGMLAHCDFEEQVCVQGTEGVMRPDLVVRLPGSKQVVVDAKVPLEAFLDANDAADDVDRRRHLQLHARQLRTHVDALSKKAYWQQFEDTPEFVVAFVPGDPLLAAALEHDPALLEYAFGRGVHLATPTTLIALLRTVAHGWRSEALAENAREVQQIGKEMYRRLAAFGDHMVRTGRGLRQAVTAYNKAVGSLEHSVLPQARRFSELGVVGGSGKEPMEIEQIDIVARQMQAPELLERSPSLELLSGIDDDADDDEDAAGPAALP